MTTGRGGGAAASRASLYFHTLRFLRPRQLASRVLFRLQRPRPDLRAAPSLRARAHEWSRTPPADARVDADRRFRLLNVEREVATGADWNNPGWEKLWLYNLHYFDVLRSGTTTRLLARTLIEAWIRENPPCHGVGWEPYPCSLRIVNWIEWALEGGELPASALHSLAVQARHLERRLETHLLGNHLLANAKALAFAGAFFEGAEARRWLRLGLEVIDAQLAEQILADGGHFELSPMYHSIVLHDVLDLVNLAKAFRLSEAGARVDAWKACAGRMVSWLRVMCHPDGGIAFFNDAAFGIAPAPRVLEDYASRLGVEAAPGSADAIQYLHSSGYIAVRLGAMALTFDAARIGPDYLPAHAHADTLAFELSWQGRRLICNSGTSRYGVGPVRDWERSTAAHNTVAVDDQNSSEVWHGFRVARRAQPLGVGVERDGAVVRVRAAHDGYGRLPGKPIHAREIVVGQQEVQWIDRVSGRGTHRVTGRVPLHPDWTVRERGGVVELHRDGRPVLELSSMGGPRLQIEEGTYAAQFGSVVSRPVVCWTLEGPLPLQHAMRLRAL